MLRRHFLRIGKIIRCRYRDGLLIGFSHPKARYFLLRRLGNCSMRCSTSCIHAVEKKVSKEKAARLPLMSCAPRTCALWVFVGGKAEWASCPLCPVGNLPPCSILAAPLYALRVFGLFPTNTAVLDAANGNVNTLLRNVS